ncbi:MAG: efflux RND transporter periplasmic adaptor subunit [SAR324 cluster bacterium]|nr:efflux RND transporter periplasmic adaptor subunit [SAR324 cluster bacterium]
MKRKLFKSLFPLLLLAAGAWGTVKLLELREAPRTQKIRSEKVTLVHAAEAVPKSYRILVHSNAKTQPVARLGISSEIKGRVIRISENFIEGGWIEAGDLLFMINDEDYKIKVEQARSQYAKALNELTYELTIALTTQNVNSGQRNKLKNLDIKELYRAISELNSYEPKVKNAQANLESAAVNLKQVELDLTRSSVFAPFNGYIHSVNLSEGQLIQPGQSVGTLIKDHPIILKASITLEELAWINIAENRGNSQNGSRVRITKRIGEKSHIWQGEVKRQLQEVDTLGNSVTVLVEVENTYSNLGNVLPFGLFVDLEIEGNEMSETIGIPQDSLRSNNTVWLISEEERLQIQNVEIKWKTDHEYLVARGIMPGARVITSYLPTPIPGMKLKIFDPEQASGPDPGKRAGPGKEAESLTKSGTSEKAPRQEGWKKRLEAGNENKKRKKLAREN